MSAQNDLLLNNRFIVVLGPLVIGFAKVSNISDSYSLTQIPEGGNPYPIFLPDQKKQPETLVLEKGVKSDVYSLMVDLALKPGVPIVGITIMVLDIHGIPFKNYFIDQGIITKCEASGLDGRGNEVLIKRMTITHTGLYEI